MSEENAHNGTRKRAMLDALEKCYGIVTDACKITGLGRRTHYTWLEDDPEYKKAVEELDNVALDHSESKLHQLIEGVYVEKDLGDGETVIYQKEPNATAVIFHLKTRGKKRGYIEKEPETANDTNKLTPAQFVEAMVSATTPRNVPPETIGVVE